LNSKFTPLVFELIFKKFSIQIWHLFISR